MNKIEKFCAAVKDHEGWYPGSRAFRNHNPGNFRCSKLMTELGAIRCDDNFSVFKDDESGWKALVQFVTYACKNELRAYKNKTIYGFFEVYAPSGDKNNPRRYADIVAKAVGVSPETKMSELLIDATYKPMHKRIHLFAHMDRNFVRKGNRVVKNETPIGTIGTGNGQYYAHLHFSISEGLTPAQLKAYVKGWNKAKVEAYYRDPRKVDFAKMFGTKMDVGNFGYDWLQTIPNYGFHPGVDVNGLKGGNTDFGMPFKSSCTGMVIWEERTWFKNGGWGNLVLVAED